MTELCLRLVHEQIVDFQFLCCYWLELVQGFLFFVEKVNIVCDMRHASAISSGRPRLETGGLGLVELSRTDESAAAR